MKRVRFLFWVIFAGAFIGSCGSSIDIPSTEESVRSIAEHKPLLDTLDTFIAKQTLTLPRGHDLITRTRSSAVNKLLYRIANRTLKDIRIEFLATRPLWKEDKSVLGIGFTNHVDIDTGVFDIDLKKFVFSDFSDNIINAQIEIDGIGMIRASGKYAGVTAGISPQIRLYLDEPVQFTVTAADSDFIRLNPVPKTVVLKTKVTLSLLGLNVPYYREIPLEITDLIKPILIPSAVQSEIVFPIPASQFGTQRMTFVKRFLRFSKSAVRAHGDGLEYRSNISFEKQ